MDIFIDLGNDFNFFKQIYELNTMLYEEKPFHFFRQEMSFAQKFEKYLLRMWPCAKGRIDLQSLLRDLKIDFILKSTQPKNEKEALYCLQFNYNMIEYANEYKENLHTDKKTFETFYCSAKKKIEYILSHIGYNSIKNPSDDYYIIVKRNNAMEFVAIQNADFGFNLNEYTSPLYQKNIKRKREIWLKLSNEAYTIVAKFKTKYNSGLVHSIARDLSSILENFAIRHPNDDKRKSSDFREGLLNYTDDEWEEIYDTAYVLLQTLLLLDDYNENLNAIVRKHENKIHISKKNSV